MARGSAGGSHVASSQARSGARREAGQGPGGRRHPLLNLSGGTRSRPASPTLEESSASPALATRLRPHPRHRSGARSPPQCARPLHLRAGQACQPLRATPIPTMRSCVPQKEGFAPFMVAQVGPDQGRPVHKHMIRMRTPEGCGSGRANRLLPDGSSYQMLAGRIFVCCNGLVSAHLNTSDARGNVGRSDRGRSACSTTERWRTRAATAAPLERTKSALSQPALACAMASGRPAAARSRQSTLEARRPEDFGRNLKAFNRSRRTRSRGGQVGPQQGRRIRTGDRQHRPGQSLKGALGLARRCANSSIEARKDLR